MREKMTRKSPVKIDSAVIILFSGWIKSFERDCGGPGPDIGGNRGVRREENRMKTIKGPALFLAQFAGDAAPFNSWAAITKWAADCGYKGVQVPTWDGRLFDLDKAAASKDYCDEVQGRGAENGVVVTELSTHLQGQLVAVHPAYDEAFDGFAAPQVRGNPKARQAWAVEQVKMALTASRNLGIDAHGDASPARWPGPIIYPWPQRPAGLVETAFDELAKRWRPILDHAEDCGVDVCYEIHPGEDLHDGVTFEMFLERVGNHAARQHALRSVALRAAVPRLSRLHRHLSRSASGCSTSRMPSSIRPAGRASMAATSAGSTAPAASARSATGRSISGRSSPSWPPYDFDGWAVVEWECCLKHPEDGAREGAEFVRDHIIRVTEKAFDDFAGGGTDEAANRRMLGISDGRTAMAIEGSNANSGNRATHPSGHGRRRARRLHRRRAPHRRAHRRPLRAGGRRAVLDAGEVAGVRPPISGSPPTASMATSRRWRSARRG